MPSVELIVGDCREVMRGLVAECVDAIVCDPPYEIGFMSRRWDNSGIAYDVEMWREAYRVLKPGAHLLAFGGSRTYHRLACAIEDAGFEIRDQLQWLYGSGFPKSLDVSKAMDKRRHDDVRPVCRFLRAAMDAAGMNSRAIAERFSFHSRMVDHWAARDTDSQPSVPTPEQWLALKDLLGFGDEMDAEVWRLNGRKGQPGEAWHEREVVGQVDSGLHRGSGNTVAFGVGNDRTQVDITAPATDLAHRWQGFGTALKPAHEPIVLARKPLIGTVAANVTEHGTGALNIDGCRIETTDSLGGGDQNGKTKVKVEGWDRPWMHDEATKAAHAERVNANVAHAESLGRWPANVCLDEDAAELLGEPSRFYFCAKSSRAERNAGLDERVNVHPTVKPISLMRWLVRLVTPPAGLVLDPFLGSGSTGCAAMYEGFDFLGCDLDAEYVEIARRRIAHHAALAEKARESGSPQLALFDGEAA